MGNVIFSGNCKDCDGPAEGFWLVDPVNGDTLPYLDCARCQRWYPIPASTFDVPTDS